MSATVQISDLLSQRYRLKLAVEDTIANAGQSQTAPAAANSTQAPKPAVTEQASGPAAPAQSTTAVPSSTKADTGATATDKTPQQAKETAKPQAVVQNSQTGKTDQAKSTAAQTKQEQPSQLFEFMTESSYNINEKQLAAIFPSDYNLQHISQTIKVNATTKEYDQKDLTSKLYSGWRQVYESNHSNISASTEVYKTYIDRFITHWHKLNENASYYWYPNYIKGRTGIFTFPSPQYISAEKAAGLYSSLSNVQNIISKNHPNALVNSLLSQIYNVNEYSKQQLAHALAVWEYFDINASNNISTVTDTAYQLEKIKTALTYFVAYNTSGQQYNPSDKLRIIDDTKVNIPSQFVVLDATDIMWQLQQLRTQVYSIMNNASIPGYVKSAIFNDYNITHSTFRLFTDNNYHYWQFLGDLPYIFQKAACVDFLPAAQKAMSQGFAVKPKDLTTAFQLISSAINAKDKRYEQPFAKYALNYFMAQQLKAFQQTFGGTSRLP